MNYKKTLQSFVGALGAAVNEKDVEGAYRAMLSELLPESEPWRSPSGVDGILSVPACDAVKNGASLLVEFKWDVELSQRTDRAKVLSQVLYYLKRLEGDAQARKLPTAVLVGDVNEFFLLPTQPLLPYLSEPDTKDGGAWDWSLAPSAAHTQGQLVLRLAQDSNLTPSWVWLPHEQWFTESSLVEVRKKLLAALNSKDYLVNINPDSMISVFERWCSLVLHPSEEKKMSAQEKVGLFMRSLLDRESVYQHPKSASKLVVEGRKEPVRIVAGTHQAFWTHFRDRYSVTEKRAFTANKDRLVEEENRRRTGEFMTPAIWVDEAHKHLDETLGADWRDKYVVWDCSCGTANLTRDYSFRRLYLSTLNQEDVDTIKSMHYNGAGLEGGAHVFRFDFLNDETDKLPKELREALEDPDMPVLFLNNPPYAKGSGKAKKTKGAANTMVREEMKLSNVSNSNQLYAQFMYRIGVLVGSKEDAVVALFSPSNHMRSSSYSKFTEWWVERFSGLGGFIFCANEFADVSGTWGICFNAWKVRSENRETSWTFDVKTRIRGAAEEILSVGQKQFYVSAYDVAQGFSEYKDFDSTEKVNWRLNGAMTPQTNEGSAYGLSLFSEEYVGYYNRCNVRSPLSQGNIVYAASGPTVWSAPFNMDGTRAAAIAMTIRDVIAVNWLNGKDEFLAPNESHPQWPRWMADTLLYLPLCGKGEFSGLRNLKFPDADGVERVYHVKNHWVLLPRERVMDLADEVGFDALYADAELYQNPPRKVTPLYDEVLLSEPVSASARRCFEEARRLTELTIRSGSRGLLCDERPEYHLQAWDAGWKQTRKVLEEYHRQEWEAWKVLHDAWRAELRELVYELGYLKK